MIENIPLIRAIENLKDKPEHSNSRSSKGRMSVNDRGTNLRQGDPFSCLFGSMYTCIYLCVSIIAELMLVSLVATTGSPGAVTPLLLVQERSRCHKVGLSFSPGSLDVGALPGPLPLQRQAGLRAVGPPQVRLIVRRRLSPLNDVIILWQFLLTAAKRLGVLLLIPCLRAPPITLDGIHIQLRGVIAPTKAIIEHNALAPFVDAAVLGKRVMRAEAADDHGAVFVLDGFDAFPFIDQVQGLDGEAVPEDGEYDKPVDDRDHGGGEVVFFFREGFARFREEVAGVFDVENLGGRVSIMKTQSGMERVGRERVGVGRRLGREDTPLRCR